PNTLPKPCRCSTISHIYSTGHRIRASATDLLTHCSIKNDHTHRLAIRDGRGWAWGWPKYTTIHIRLCCIPWRQPHFLVIQTTTNRLPLGGAAGGEGEYRGVANAVAETIWIRNLLLELHWPSFNGTHADCDNVSAVYLSTNPIQHQRTKHIELDILFVRERVALGQVRVLHVPSAHQYADIFTK
ncbi:unnamed protein product, partial [Arabidopsis halleri]